MTFSFLKKEEKKNYHPTESSFNFSVVLYTLILLYLSGSWNNFVALLLMSFK